MKGERGQGARTCGRIGNESVWRCYGCLPASPLPCFLVPCPTRILLIRPDHIGDLLFTTPALRALHAAFPQAHIACLVGPWGDPARHLVLLSDLDCIPCNRLDYSPEELADHPCMRLISVEQVLAACERLIREESVYRRERGER